MNRALSSSSVDLNGKLNQSSNRDVPIMDRRSSHNKTNRIARPKFDRIKLSTTDLRSHSESPSLVNGETNKLRKYTILQEEKIYGSDPSIEISHAPPSLSVSSPCVNVINGDFPNGMSENRGFQRRHIIFRPISIVKEEVENSHTKKKNYDNNTISPLTNEIIERNARSNNLYNHSASTSNTLSENQKIPIVYPEERQSNGDVEEINIDDSLEISGNKFKNAAIVTTAVIEFSNKNSGMVQNELTPSDPTDIDVSKLRKIHRHAPITSADRQQPSAINMRAKRPESFGTVSTNNTRIGHPSDDLAQINTDVDSNHSLCSTPTLEINEIMSTDQANSVRIISARSHLGLNSRAEISNAHSSEGSVTVEFSTDQFLWAPTLSVPTAIRDGSQIISNSQFPNANWNMLLNQIRMPVSGVVEILPTAGPRNFTNIRTIKQEVSFDLSQNKCYEFKRTDVPKKYLPYIAGYVSFNGDAPGEGVNEHRTPYHKLFKIDRSGMRLNPLPLVALRLERSEFSSDPFTPRPRLRMKHYSDLRRPAHWRNSMDMERNQNISTLDLQPVKATSTPALATIPKPQLLQFVNTSSAPQITRRPRLRTWGNGNHIHQQTSMNRSSWYGS